MQCVLEIVDSEQAMHYDAAGKFRPTSPPSMLEASSRIYEAVTEDAYPHFWKHEQLA